jgi:N-methylhydantoinase B
MTGGPTTQLDDPVAIEIVRNGLAAIADEMAITEVRAAYSTVVRDMLDFSTAVCDGEGRVLAQGLSLALQLGAVPRFLEYVRARYPEPQPGDVYLVNDPWQGGVHLPDLLFAKPVFCDGEATPIAYAVIVSHVVDVGGRFPGSISPVAGSLWEEGLVLPLARLVREGVVEQPLLDILAANTRDPVRVLGDVRAVLAGLETGARQVLDLARRLGSGELRGAMIAFLDHTERATRAALGRVPDGVGSAADRLDDDGVGGPPVGFACRVEKRGGSLSFDFTGTDPQVASGINCTVADVRSVVAFTARAAIGEDIPVNDGFTRCLDWHVPDGTVVSARRPAAVGSRAAAIYRLTDVAMAALSQIVPGRMPANDGGPGVVYVSGQSEDGSTWIFLDYVQAGWGASSDADGVAGVSHPISNAGNIPVEVVEGEYPIRIGRYALVDGSGGRGARMGAPAVMREYEFLTDGVTLNIRTERRFNPPSGSNGGGSGTPSTCLLRRAGGEWEEIPAKGSTAVGRGDAFRLVLASGGGYGDPETGVHGSARASGRDGRDERFAGRNRRAPGLLDRDGDDGPRRDRKLDRDDSPPAAPVEEARG